ncbi:MAG: EamA family transporter, partial [Anaerolineae bacterium]
MSRRPVRPMIQALLAALLFGASTPAAKLLLGEIEPVPLSALLYLGSGLGLLTTQAMRRLNGGPTTEAPLDRRDLPWLIGAVMAGGVAAPIVLLFSLRVTPAATASLLLTFEGGGDNAAGGAGVSRGHRSAGVAGHHGDYVGRRGVDTERRGRV